MRKKSQKFVLFRLLRIFFIAFSWHFHHLFVTIPHDRPNNSFFCQLTSKNQKKLTICINNCDTNVSIAHIITRFWLNWCKSERACGSINIIKCVTQWHCSHTSGWKDAWNSLPPTLLRRSKLVIHRTCSAWTFKLIANYDSI